MYNDNLSFDGKAGFEDGSELVVFITNQSFGVLPTELELTFDCTFMSLRPPVEGIKELCTGMYIC